MFFFLNALLLSDQQYSIDEVIVLSTTVCANDCLALMTWRAANESCEPETGIWSSILDWDDLMAYRGAIQRRGSYCISSLLGTFREDRKPAHSSTITPSHWSLMTIYCVSS